jgi:putative oxidoreductase
MPGLTMPAFGSVSLLAPLVLRVVAGLVMAAHGYSKLAAGPSTFAEMLQGLGVPAPGFMAWVVTLVELVGGILLILGLITRIAGLLIAIDLAVAALLVKVDVGLIAGPGEGAGAELELTLLAATLALALMGPGPVSIDRAVGLERPAPPGAAP